ncbi:MAG: hypothetical protein K8H88_12350 [Sandaracinaceae bacterium]|nr:hypothetical protein [Sandaracinaceae bacterium]
MPTWKQRRTISAADLVARFDQEAGAAEGSIGGSGADAWSAHVWQVLHRVARGLDVYCACSRGGHEPGCGEQREWLWDLSWYEPGGDERFVQPLVLIEHENAHGESQFLDDWWKVLAGYAPLRVMIGYTTSAEALPRRIDLVRARTRRWIFPRDASDVVILRGHGTPRWRYLVRAAGARDFLEIRAPKPRA